jgi:hypothetical protein
MEGPGLPTALLPELDRFHLFPVPMLLLLLMQLFNLVMVLPQQLFLLLWLVPNHVTFKLKLARRTM